VRAPQQIQCAIVIMLTHEEQAHRVQHIGIVGFDRQRLAQQLGSLPVHTARAVEIGKIDHGRNKRRIQTQCRSIFNVRLRRIAAPHLQ